MEILKDFLGLICSRAWISSLVKEVIIPDKKEMNNAEKRKKIENKISIFNGITSLIKEYIFIKKLYYFVYSLSIIVILPG